MTVIATILPLQTKAVCKTTRQLFCVCVEISRSLSKEFVAIESKRSPRKKHTNFRGTSGPRTTRPIPSRHTYQGSVLRIGDDVRLVDKDILLGRSIFASWGDETKSLLVRKPLYCSLDFSHDADCEERGEMKRIGILFASWA